MCFLLSSYQHIVHFIFLNLLMLLSCDQIFWYQLQESFETRKLFSIAYIIVHFKKLGWKLGNFGFILHSFEL